MSSSIEQLIDEIEEYIDGCRMAPFSQNKIMVERDQIEELLDELRHRTPEEIKKYQRIVSNKEAIIADAKKQAEEIIDEAKRKRERILEEHEIIREAYERGNDIIKESMDNGQKIMDQAVMEANTYRLDIEEYVNGVMAGMLDMTTATIEAVQERFQSYMEYMKDTQEQLNHNMAALMQTDEEYEEYDEAYEEYEENVEEQVEEVPEEYEQEEYDEDEE